MKKWARYRVFDDTLDFAWIIWEKDTVSFIEILQELLAITPLFKNRFEESCILGYNVV